MTTASDFRPGDRVVLAIGFMLLSMACFSLLNAAAKYLTAYFPVSQVVWSRYVGSLAFMLIVFLPRAGTWLFRPERPGSQIVRGFLLFLSSFFYFRALQHLPLSVAAAISLTSPLIVTAFSMPFLGERVGLRRWLAVVVGFVGALVVVRPGLGAFDWAVLYVVASTVSSSFYQLYTRKYGSRERPDTSATIATIVGTLAAAPFLPFEWVTPSEGWHLALFAVMGVFAGAGHYFLTVSFSRAPAAVIAPFNYTQLIGAALMGYIVFQHVPDLWTWVGAGIITASGLYIGHREHVRRRQALGQAPAGGAGS